MDDEQWAAYVEARQQVPYNTQSPKKSKLKLYLGIGLVIALIITAIVLMAVYVPGESTTTPNNGGNEIIDENEVVNEDENTNINVIPELVSWDPPSQYYGTAQGNWAGEPFQLECNQGADDYIDSIMTFITPVSNRIPDHPGEEMARLGVRCKSSTDNDYNFVGPIPQSPERNYELEELDGFNTVQGLAGYGVVTMDAGNNGISGTIDLDPAQGGNPWTFTCDGKIRGIHGRIGGGERLDPYDARIGKIGFVCK